MWNSSNFMFHARVFLDEYRAFDPDSAAAVTAAGEHAGNDLSFVTLKAGDFARAAAKSVDYAVMEKTTRAALVPVSYAWSDVGSWQAVWDLADKDAAGNAAQGTAVFVDSKSSYATSDRALVSLYGVENLVVVSSEDACSSPTATASMASGRW
jgi:mannose-1-phosphate guanylyltransferase / mannose-6-phosphate isomerase